MVGCRVRAEGWGVVSPDGVAVVGNLIPVFDLSRSVMIATSIPVHRVFKITPATAHSGVWVCVSTSIRQMQSKCWNYDTKGNMTQHGTNRYYFMVIIGLESAAATFKGPIDDGSRRKFRIRIKKLRRKYRAERSRPDDVSHGRTDRASPAPPPPHRSVPLLSGSTGEPLQ